jgi:hypothetical protein
MSLFYLLLSCMYNQREIDNSQHNRDLDYIKNQWELGGGNEFPNLLIETAKKSDDPILLWAYGTEVYARRGRNQFNRRDLDLSRRFGFKCLTQDKSFSSLVVSNGGQINRQAIEALDETNYILRNCAQWTVISWALWLQERGPQGASYDIATVKDLASWVQRYHTGPWVHYAIAISESLVPVYENPNWNKMKNNFEQCLLLDDLVEFEMNYYVTRFIDKESYCNYQLPNGLVDEYNDRFIDSKYFCTDDQENDERPQ